MLSGLFKSQQSHAVGGPIGSMADARSQALSFPKYDNAYLLHRLAGARANSGTYDHLINRYRPDQAAKLDMAEKMVYLMHAAKGHEAEAEECLKKEFKLWLAGRHPDNASPKPYNNAKGGLLRRDPSGKQIDTWYPTWWGKKQLTHLPGVREYLREDHANADKNSFDMNMLAHFGPSNLDEAFAYFKYWVKGRPVDEKCMVTATDNPKFPFQRSGPISMGSVASGDILQYREGFTKEQVAEDEAQSIAKNERATRALEAQLALDRRSRHRTAIEQLKREEDEQFWIDRAYTERDTGRRIPIDLGARSALDQVMDLLETDPETAYALTETMDEFETRGPRPSRPRPPRPPPPPPPPAPDPVLEPELESEPAPGEPAPPPPPPPLQTNELLRAEVMSAAEYNSIYGPIDGIEKASEDRLEAIATRLGPDRTQIMVRDIDSINAQLAQATTVGELYDLHHALERLIDDWERMSENPDPKTLVPEKPLERTLDALALEAFAERPIPQFRREEEFLSAQTRRSLDTTPTRPRRLSSGTSDSGTVVLPGSRPATSPIQTL